MQGFLYLDKLSKRGREIPFVKEKVFPRMKEPNDNMPTHIQFQSVHLCMSLHSYWVCSGGGVLLSEWLG